MKVEERSDSVKSKKIKMEVEEGSDKAKEKKIESKE